MAYRNFYRVIISNDFLGLSKEISAPSRYELDLKVENQKKIWEEKVNREINKQNKEQMKIQAEKLTNLDKIKIENYDNLINIIFKTNHNEYYNSMIDNSTFQKFKTNLQRPNIEIVFFELNVPKKSIFEKIFKRKLEKRLSKENEATELFELRTKKFDEELKKEKNKYEELKKEFYSNQEQNNSIIKKEKEDYEKVKPLEIEKYFSYVLNKSNYPTDFVKDFELQYVEEKRTLVISYYLPNERIIPKTIEHKYIASKNKIEEIKLTDKKFEIFYNNIIYMCCLRTIKEIFSSDDLNYIDDIVYNGWIKYIDKSNGKDTESCILTVDVDKKKFNELNLSNVEYKACIRGLKGVFAPNLLNLTPVIPYLNISREDSRFIENKEVMNITMDGFNLATMPWEDFEYFVRELFDKMFNTDGGEVKVTQASHDGGVDAIAFDDDPIRGGKFVIQAKRYNNVVPVSAVRDLYGTMIHEGATKGILVTTSFYGKEAYDFAKDKPLTLIDGSALLGMLNKYGYSKLTIKIDK